MLVPLLLLFSTGQSLLAAPPISIGTLGIGPSGDEQCKTWYREYFRSIQATEPRYQKKIWVESWGTDYLPGSTRVASMNCSDTRPAFLVEGAENQGVREHGPFRFECHSGYSLVIDPVAPTMWAEVQRRTGKAYCNPLSPEELAKQIEVSQGSAQCVQVEVPKLLTRRGCSLKVTPVTLNLELGPMRKRARTAAYIDVDGVRHFGETNMNVEMAMGNHKICVLAGYESLVLEARFV